MQFSDLTIQNSEYVREFDWQSATKDRNLSIVPES